MNDKSKTNAFHFCPCIILLLSANASSFVICGLSASKYGTHAALYEALRYRTPYQQIQDPAPYQQNAAMDQQTTEMPNRFENQNMDQPFEDRTDY